MRLKAAALAVASCLLATVVPARADALLVGVVTDQDGVPVAGARLVARDARGAPVGSGRSTEDGSFAVTAVPAGAASRLDVGCDYCQARSVGLVPGEPAVVVVRRFAALRDRGLPQPEDLAALPPQTLAAATALIPFAVAARGGASDRGLLLGRDASAADGVPLYRRIDGISLANLVPAVALRRLDPVGDDAVEASRAFEASLADAGGPALRGATSAAGGAALDLRSGGAALLAATGNGGYDLASAAARLPFAGGRLTATALGANWLDERLAGATLAYATASRRYETAASVAVARSVVDALPDAELLFDAHLRARTPAEPTLGVRGRTSSGGGAAPGTQVEDAAYASARAPLPGGTLTLGLAAGREAYPSLAYDAARPGFALHAGLTAYALAPAPGDPVAFARAARAELSLERSDLRRLDLLATVYRERIGGDLRSTLTGVGVRLGWQIAPRLGLRAWLLGAQRAVVAPGARPAGYGPASTTYGYGPPLKLAGRVDRRLVWLTYDNPLRFDVLYRGGPFDASVSAPLGGTRVGLGTTTAIDGRRVLTLTLTR